LIISKAKTMVSISGLRRAASGPLLAMQFTLLLLGVQSARAQTYTVLHEFTGADDGGNPAGGVIRDAAGNLYGTTYDAGAFGYGVVFKLDSAGKETVLHTFTGADGIWPDAGLIRDSSGNLYGTTWDGGAAEGGTCKHGCGTVFKVDSTGKETVLYAFTGDTDGRNPEAGLVRDAVGNLYGTTSTGGNPSCRSYQHGCGVVFKVDKDGKETVLHAFMDTDGDDPVGSLIRDKAGNLYGVTWDGGAYDDGVVFKVDPVGKLTVLHSFAGGTMDGSSPRGSLVRDASGNLYGTTLFGGDTSCSSYGCGVVFKLDKTGKETILYAFTGGADEGNPSRGLIRDMAGNLYGTTEEYSGELFKLDNKGEFKVLYFFGTGGDGVAPTGLIRDDLGNFYGTASRGGKLNCPGGAGCGVVFKFTP
jgi:uncharacterized repeat protein (TIGR03803 family)